MKKYVVFLLLAVLALLSACNPKAVLGTTALTQAAPAETLLPSATATQKPTDILPTQMATHTPEPTSTPSPTRALKLISYQGHQHSLIIYDLDANETFPLIENMEMIPNWSLSLDNQSLIYQLQIWPDAPPDEMTCLLDLTTKQVRGAIPYAPQLIWHPSGKAILVFNRDNLQYELFRLEDGVVVGNLPYGSFSPDGNKLAAFVERKLRIYDILMDENGKITGISNTYSESDLRLDEKLWPGLIVWSPMGDKLAFGVAQSWDNPASYLFIVNPDGSGLVQMVGSNTLEPGVQ